MNKFIKFSLLMIALIFVFGAFANFTEVKAQAPAAVIRELLQKMEDNRKSLTSMRANLRMEKFNSQIGDSDVMEGTVVYLPNKKLKKPNVRIDWSKPREEQLSVIDGKFKLYRKALNIVYVGKAESQANKVGGALDFMNMSSMELKQNFKSDYLGTETIGNNFSTYKLKLTPKNSNYAKYNYAEVWIDENGMPLQAKITEKSGDWTSVLLSNIDRNATLDIKQFQLVIPKGVKEIAG